MKRLVPNSAVPLSQMMATASLVSGTALPVPANSTITKIVHLKK
jgi:hypothetical protein